MSAIGGLRDGRLGYKTLPKRGGRDDYEGLSFSPPAASELRLSCPDVSNRNEKERIKSELQRIEVKTEIQYVDGLISSGALKDVAAHVIFQSPGLADIHALLIGYRTFESAPIFFEMVQQIYTSVIISTPNQSLRVERKARLLNFIQEWAEKFFTDFEGNKLFNSLLAFVETLNSEEANKLKLIFVKRWGLKRMANKNTPHIPTTPENVNIFDTQPQEIAEQITLLEAELIQEISVTEFLDQAWQKPTKERLAPNLVRLCHRFNQISFWVASTIVCAKNKRDQITFLKKFIEVAKKLLSFRNFNSFMAVLAGINNFAVQRLKPLFASISTQHKEMLDKLQNVISPEGNFKNYRMHVKETPSIPCIAICLKDITFLYDGNPDYASTKTINFDKFRMLGNYIFELENHCRLHTNYNFSLNRTLAKYLEKVSYLSEDDIYESSKQCDKFYERLSTDALPKNTEAESKGKRRSRTSSSSNDVKVYTNPLMQLQIEAMGMHNLTTANFNTKKTLPQATTNPSLLSVKANGRFASSPPSTFPNPKHVLGSERHSQLSNIGRAGNTSTPVVVVTTPNGISENS